MKWDIGNTETPSSNQNCGIEQKIEGQDMQHLAYGTSSANTMTLSFWVYSNKTGTYCVQLMQPDGTKYQLHEYTVSSSNTWEKKTITIVGNTSDAINDDNTQGMRILWHLTCGSSDHVAASSTWTSGDSFHATSNQVNLWDNGSNHWYLTGCQLEIGTTATEFEHRGYGEELSLCQRYYYMHADGSQSTGQYEPVGTGCWYSGSEFYTAIQHPTSMRTTPSLDQTSVTNYYYLNNAGAGGGFSDFSSMWKVSANMSYLQKTGSSGTQGAASMIYVSTTSSKLGFSAEL